MARCVGMLLDGRVARGLQQRMDKPGDILMMVVNSHHEDLPFTVPSVPGVVGWQTLLDTAQPGRKPHMLDAGGNFQASGRSLVLLSALHDGAVWTTAEPARAAPVDAGGRSPYPKRWSRRRDRWRLRQAPKRRVDPVEQAPPWSSRSLRPEGQEAEPSETR